MYFLLIGKYLLNRIYINPSHIQIMALCGFNEKMLEGIKTFLDGAIEYGIIDKAKNKGISVDEQVKNELYEISQWNYYSRKVDNGPTQKQIEGLGLLVGGTFEKDQKRGISNYKTSHILDLKLLKEIDDYYYNELNGDVKNMPRLFGWVNKNLENYKI